MYSGVYCVVIVVAHRPALAAAIVLIAAVAVLLLLLMPLPICFDFNPAYSPTASVSLSFARL